MATDRVNNFAGGQTDRLENGQSNTYAKAKNLLIDENFNLDQRYGFTPWKNTARPFGTQSIDGLYRHKTRSTNNSGSSLLNYEFMTHSGTGVYYTTDNPSGTFDIISRVDSVNQGSNNVFNAGQYPQSNFVRINDNEFVLLSGFDNLTGGLSTTKRPFLFSRTGSLGVEWQYASMGLPLHNSFTATKSGAGGAFSYVYAIYLEVEYAYFDGTTRLIQGPTVLDRIESSAAIGGGGITTLAFPSFDTTNLGSFDDTNGEIIQNGVFDYANVRVKVYRTTGDGTILYLLATLPANSTGYGDVVTDGGLDLTKPLYTTGGILDSDMSPRVAYGTYANNCLWLASDKQVYQSKPNIPYGVNGATNLQAPETEHIVGMGKRDVYPILFTEGGVYRIEGVVDGLGNGAHRVRTITETHVALSQRSIVEGEDVLYFLTKDGPYVTDGFSARKVTKNIDDTYEALISDKLDLTQRSNFISGTYDQQNRRVYFFYPSVSGQTHADRWMVIDTRKPNQEGIPAILENSGQDLQITSVIASEKEGLIFGDKRGVLGSQAERTDYDQDISRDPDWTTKAAKHPILWDYESPMMSAGSEFIRKWYTKIDIFFKKKSPTLSATLMSKVDDADTYQVHHPIRQDTLKAKGNFFIAFRRFVKGFLRATYRTIRITNSELSEMRMHRSDDYATASVAGNLVSIDAGNWPTDTFINQYILFEGDPTYHKIATVNPTSISLDSNPIVGANSRWEIYGARPDEHVNIAGYTMVYEPIGDSHTRPSGAEGAGNAP